MKAIVEIEFEDCGDCPMCSTHTEQGFHGEVCNHPKAPRGYDNIIQTWPDVPEWCPIKIEGSIEHELV